MSYAKLGSTCYANMRVLTDNRKFLDTDADVYKVLYTKSSRHSGQTHDLSTLGDIDYPEDIKFKKNTKQHDENYKENYQQKSCCGKN